MIYRLSFICLIIMTLTACTTTERMSWGVAGGSKSDGIIILGIDVPAKLGISETHVEWDAQQANYLADSKCKKWGYAGAEAFNEEFPVQKTCHPQGFSPCWSKTYRVAYQCIDKADGKK